MRTDVSLFARAVLVAASLLLGGAVRAQGAAAPAAPPPSVSDQAQRAMRFGDLAELERLYALHGRPGVRSEQTGVPGLELFWDGVREISDPDYRVTEHYYLQLDALTRQWATDHPRSVLAQLIHAQALLTHAWFFRGGGYANTVSDESWVSFRKYLELSHAQLRRSEALAEGDSSWNHLMMRVGRGLNWDTRRLLGLMEGGLARNPDHDDLYFVMLQTLQPRWSGDLPTMERFVATVTQQTREKRGMEMYARLYAAISYDEVHHSLFEATRASWPAMKDGFEARLARYPHADHHNMYAYFACLAKDREVLQEQLRLMGDRFNKALWGTQPERRFEECKRVAHAS